MYNWYDKMFRKSKVKSILIEECLQLNDRYMGVISYMRRMRLRKYYEGLTIEELEREKQTLIELIRLGE